MNRRQIRILATELQRARYSDALAASDYDGIATQLNERKTVPNPEPQRDVPVRFTWQTFIGNLSAADLIALYAQGDLARDLRAALEANDRPLMLALWRAAKTVLSAKSVTAVVAAFGATEPDPDWTPTITRPSRAQTLGLPVVRPEDVLLAAQMAK